VQFDGTVWRHIPRDTHPLHAGYILQAAGRWNREGLYGALYTSLSKHGAIAELLKLTAHQGIPISDLDPRDLVSIKVTCSPVLDLTSIGVRRRFGITLVQLRSDTFHSIEHCRTIADLGRQQGFRGILAPSAADNDATNLVVYLEGPTQSLWLEEGGKRFAINYGESPLLDTI